MCAVKGRYGYSDIDEQMQFAGMGDCIETLQSQPPTD